MGILDKIIRKREEEIEWVDKRIIYWREKYETCSKEELREQLKMLNKKAVLESLDSPYGASFWLGGFTAKNMPKLETEIQRQVIRNLLAKKEP